MKKILTIVSLTAAVLGMVSCASADKMAKMAEQVTVDCNPSPLVVKGGKIDADLTVNYPAKYFNKKAIMEVTPVIVYGDKELAGEPIMYQGEKVEDNYTVVAYDGGTVSKHLTFKYSKGMEICSLELRGRCTTDGKKWVTLPTKKVADGLNINETLICSKGYYDYKADAYQAVIVTNPEAQIMYTINSSEVRSKELRNASVNALKETLAEAQANERKTIKDIEVIAYASPDGGEKLNAKLSDRRSKTADKAATKVMKSGKIKGVSTEVKSVGQDWEGFQECVAKSDVEDKDLIIRVLSMYNDPAVREKEIRNMSSVYQELAKDVLPQLRRARLVANVEYKNYTDEELLELVKTNVDVLDEEALLKVASISPSADAKVEIYTIAANKYNSARAAFNLAVLSLNDKENDEAKTTLAALDAKDADVINAKGVIALRAGDCASAKSLFASANTADAKKNLAVVDVKEGNYAAAVAKFGNEKSANAAVAKLLNGDVAGALATVKDVDTPQANYVKAICLNRQGKVSEAKAALKKATDACKKLAERAKVDIEVANLK